MYLRRVQIMNIRSITKLDWSISADEAAGWHVIIGDNGSGKSSFLRSIALAIVGPTEAIALRQDWNDWLHPRRLAGSVRLDISHDGQWDQIIAAEDVVG